MRARPAQPPYKNRRPTHPHVPVSHPIDGEVFVDIDLAAALELLWARGIDTLFSCQGNENLFVERDRGYILMLASDAAYDYVRAVLQAFDDHNPPLVGYLGRVELSMEDSMHGRVIRLGFPKWAIPTLELATEEKQS